MKRTLIIAALVPSTVSIAIAQQQSVRTQDTPSIEQAVQQQDQERGVLVLVCALMPHPDAERCMTAR